MNMAYEYYVFLCRHCKLLLFYVSGHSLRSEACLKEWEETSSQRTQRNHRGEVPTLVVEAEPIDNIIHYCDKVQMQMEEEIEAIAAKGGAEE